MVDVMADRGKAFWVITVAAVLLTAVGVRLGVWQLDRAHQKEAWVAAIANQASRPALGNQGVAQVASQGSNSRGGGVCAPAGSPNGSVAARSYRVSRQSTNERPRGILRRDTLAIGGCDRL